jgi:EF hand
MPTDQGERDMRRPRSPRPLAGLAAAVCALVPLLGAAPADAQQSTIPDVCPGGEMRGPDGECVPGTGMGGSAAQTTAPDPHHSDAAPPAAQPEQPGMMPPGMMPPGMMGRGMTGSGMMRHEPMMGRRGHAMKVMFAIADADGDGALSFEEVTVIHKRLFDGVDADDDGKVTAEEVQAFLRE